MANLTPKRPTKPEKPHPDFPLTPHPSGRWCKKVRGQLHYFGPWADPDGALETWLEQKDDLLAGRKPRVKGEGLTVRQLVNHFLTAKQRKVDAGEMQRRSWLEYHETCAMVIAQLGKERAVSDLASDDFGQLRAEFAKTRGPEALGNQVQRTRCLFKYGYDAGLLEKPVRFGPEFVRPGRVARRKARQAKPPRLFSADEIRKLLKIANPQLEAMILLGINCGLGNADCATLPKSALDLKIGILDFPRPKTAIERRAVLWPETIKAIKAALALRPRPREAGDAELVFVTRHGQPWVKFRETGNINSVTLEFSKLLEKLEINRTGVGFYALRHTFETIAGESGDQPAVDRIMGHERADMSTVYREWMKDSRENARLRKVTDHVHAWLFPPKKRTTKPSPAGG